MHLYRKISDSEIRILENNHCYCDDWGKIEVAEEFSPENYFDVRFSGHIRLGMTKKKIGFPGGISKPSGIYNAFVHNCSVGDNCLISNIKNYIANYSIGNEVVIENCELVAVEQETTFGNGTAVDVMDETGGRQILIYDYLSAHTAYILAFYRHRPELIKALENLIARYTEKKRSSVGSIGDYTRIINSREIKNACFGESAQITGVSRLKNGSVNSEKDAPVIIGSDVVADNFIISSGSEISDSAILSNCFVGQGCILGKHYSAVHSLFFANCQGFNGEACSIFAGPYTVTHHKSTLLIAGMFSFLNAGSGSNQSNHMYKLGPIHHGIIERGSKTTSDSYLLWPAKIGSFTLVMGRHYKNSDTTDMPFSYLIENKDESWLVPAVNLRSVGTIRDAMKWPKRDKRSGNHHLDFINYNLLSPYTIQRMANGQNILRNLKKVSGISTEVYSWGATFIKRNALERGIELYEMAIVKFLGNSIISRISKCNAAVSFDSLKKCLVPKSQAGTGEWADLAGLIAPKSEIKILLQKIESNQISTLKEVEEFFRQLHLNYYEYEWAWAAALIETHLHKPIPEITKQDFVGLIENWVKSVTTLDELLYEDARKEFRLSAMTGFGIDGDHETKKQDFEKVRGNFDDNPFVTEILDHIRRKTELGQQTISFLNNLKD